MRHHVRSGDALQLITKRKNFCLVIIYGGTRMTSYYPKWCLSVNCFYLSLVLIHFGSCFPFIQRDLHKKRYLHQFNSSTVSFKVCMAVDILRYQLTMAAVHCWAQSPRIVAIDPQRCVDV